MEPAITLIEKRQPMNNYTTRVGQRNSSHPAANLYRIPSEEREDDGRILVSGGSLPVCPDCGYGHLQWAEAGYVPWHRICDVCGSHWSLHPVTYIQWGQEKSWTGTNQRGNITNVDVMDPDPRLPEGVTHQLLLSKALEYGTEPNGNRKDQRIASACWAHRARFF